MTLAALLRLCVRAVLVALVEKAARHIPQPPAPPWGGRRATAHGSLLAGRLWDRYRDPEGAPCLSDHGRRMAILYAAVLDDEAIRWLAAQIVHEFAECPDHPPVSHEVHQ